MNQYMETFAPLRKNNPTAQHPAETGPIIPLRPGLILGLGTAFGLYLKSQIFASVLPTFI